MSYQKQSVSFCSRQMLFLLIWIVGLLISGCGGAPSAPPAPSPTGVTIQGPSSTSVDPSNSASLTASVTNDATNAGVMWTLSGTGCSGIVCGSLSGATTTSVTYTAPATVGTAFTAMITAASVAKSSVVAASTLSIPVNPLVATAAGELAGGTIGTAYATTLTGIGGISPYTWSVSAGALPTGISLNASSGAITGTPTDAMNPSVTVTMADSGSPALKATSIFSIAIAYPELLITTTSLPNATLDSAYTTALTATGGTGTGYSWTVTSGTALSAVGLSLSSGGTITGIPTAAEIATPMTVQVRDSGGNMATASLVLTVANVAFNGQVMSGQHPLFGATVQVYAAEAAGVGSAATPMLIQTVTTDNAGFFSIAGLYTCGQSSSGASIPGNAQIYLTAIGGTTSTTYNASNNAIAMLTAIGPCSNLSAASNIEINELTTVAAAWALAPFTASIRNIGATATNTRGITNAFLDAGLLVNPMTGTTATLATNLTIETGKLNALADALASCVDSDGGSACTPLFAAATPASGTEPMDTFSSALNIVKNPALNVATVFSASGAGTPPYAPALTQLPNDWTMSLTITGGGLLLPTSLDIDAVGNVWVADYYGAISEFSPQGAPLSGPNGFGVGDLNEVYGLTIDSDGSVWVTNEQSSPNSFGSVSKFYGSNSSTPGVIVSGNGGTNFYDSTISFPIALAADTNGDIVIDNYAPGSSATVYNSSGTYVASLGNGNVSFPTAIAIDTDHGVWFANEGDNTITHSDKYGNVLSRPSCCDQADGIATDALGNVWVANYSVSNGGSFSEVAPNGDVVINQSTVGGVQYPAGVQVDGAQNVWIANYRGGSITEIAGNGGTLAAGSAISPGAGYGHTIVLSGNPLLLEPYDVVPDASGNIWVSDNGNNDLVMFFGIAAPTATPTQPVPSVP
jgi:hypothetical protein